MGDNSIDHKKSIALALLATGFWAVGNCVQKKGHNDVNDVNTQKQAIWKSKTWITGFIIYFIGSLIGGKALACGAVAVVGTLETTTLIWNAALAAKFLGETVSTQDIQAMALIFFGCCFVALCGPKPVQDLNVDSQQMDLFQQIGEFQAKWFDQYFIGVACFLITLAIISGTILNYYLHLDVNQRSMATQKIVVKGHTPVLISYVYFTTFCWCFLIIFQKSTFTFFEYLDFGVSKNYFGLEIFKIANKKKFMI